MVLIQCFRLLHAAINPGREVLRDPHHGLQDDQDVGDEAEDGVRALEVDAPVVELVVLDDHQPGHGGEERDVVQRGVRVGALFLLLGRVCWLENEDGLDEEEEGGGVEELRERAGQLMLLLTSLTATGGW